MSTKKDEYGTCWRHNLATIGRDGCLSSCLCVCLSCPHPPGIVCTQSANGNKSGDAENLTPAVADRRRQPNRQIRRGKMKTMNGSCGSWHRLMTYQRIKSSVAAKHVHIITETVCVYVRQHCCIEAKSLPLSILCTLCCFHRFELPTAILKDSTSEIPNKLPYGGHIKLLIT